MMLATVLTAGLALGEATSNLMTEPSFEAWNPWSFGKYLLSGMSAWFSASATRPSLHSIDSSMATPADDELGRCFRDSLVVTLRPPSRGQPS
jgi:hypothetical protein